MQNIIWIFLWSIVHSSHCIYITTLAQSKRKTVKLTYKLYIKFHVKYKIQYEEFEKIKLEKVKVKTYAAADSSCRIRSMTGPRSPLWGQLAVHVSQQSSTSMFERSTLLGIGHRYSQKDPYRNRPLGLLTCARQTLTERNRLRGILGVAISIYPREDVFIRENGRPTFRLRCRSKVSASITSPQRNIVSLSLRSRCTLSKYNIDCKKIF